MKIHALGLLLHPEREWRCIHNEQESVGHMYISHAMLMAAVPAVAACIGTTHAGWRVGDGETIRLTLQSAIILSLLTWLAILGGIALMGSLIYWMSRTYDAAPDISECVVFTAYCATPMLMAGIAALQPSLTLTLIAGSIGLGWTTYLIYSGVPTFMDIPREEGFLFSTSILAVGMVLLVGLLIVSVLLWGIGIGPVYTS